MTRQCAAGSVRSVKALSMTTLTLSVVQCLVTHQHSDCSHLSLVAAVSLANAATAAHFQSQRGTVVQSTALAVRNHVVDTAA